MNVKRNAPQDWEDNAFSIECNGHERQMLLRSLQDCIKHHERKAKTLKTPGSVREHTRTAERLGDYFNAIYMVGSTEKEMT